MSHYKQHRYRLTYVLALSLVATLVVAMKVELGSTVQSQSTDARVINVAGRQRMLSQQIARHAMALAMAPPTQAAQRADALSESLELWIDSHEGLAYRDPEQGLSGTNSEKVTAYFKEIERHHNKAVFLCDQMIEQALLPAEQRPPRDELIREAIVVDGLMGQFLPMMDRIVAAYEQESTARVGSLDATAMWLSGLILLVLALEALLVFEPLLKRQRDDIDRLNAATKEAERANQVKSEFLANMSHEIRTPMSALLAYMDLLKDAEFSDSQAKLCMKTIDQSGKHLLELINDILEISKLEAGETAVESIEVNPVQVAEEAVSLIRPQAVESSLKISIDYTTPVPRRICSDPTRIRQILINLLNNAVKFTERGSITLEVACDRERQQMVFKVIDTGIGMTPEQLGRISAFAPFAQADTSMTRRYGGTGLGLRISDKFAKMLGGALEIESVHGEGSCFSLTVQTGDLSGVGWIEPDQINTMLDRGDLQGAGLDIPPDLLSDIRVLLVEDGFDLQRILRYRLHKAGAHVRVVGNGQLAVDLVRGSTRLDEPHVIVMDMQMPKMDGYTAARILRQEGRTIPIIALTAHATHEDRERCLEAGCDEFLTKPIDFKALMEACATHAKDRAA